MLPAVSTRLSMVAVAPVCEECASSAMTANDRAASDTSRRMVSSTKGKVWMVTMMIDPPLDQRLHQLCDLTPSSVTL